MFYLSENVKENFFNHQQWWKDMKKKNESVQEHQCKKQSWKKQHENIQTKLSKLIKRVARDEAEIEIDIEIN